MRKLGALIFPGFELLDLFGPMEIFGLLEKEFSLELVAEKVGPTPRSTTNQNLTFYLSPAVLEREQRCKIAIFLNGLRTHQPKRNTH